jgi:hypothetical protein
MRLNELTAGVAWVFFLAGADARLTAADADIALQDRLPRSSPLELRTRGQPSPYRAVARPGAASQASGELLAEKGSLRLRSAPRAERERSMHWLTTALSSRGDGGGGDVAELRALQTAYSDPVDGNIVLLLWTENTSNNPDGAPGGIDILVNGEVLGALPALPDAELPGTNGIQIGGVPVGTFTFGVRGVGPLMEVTQNVLALQPFPDAADLQCTEGARDPGPPPTCEMVLSWTNPGPVPTVYGVLVNGLLAGEIPGDLQGVTVTDMPPSDPGTPHCANVVGILDLDDGNYRGGFPETCCDIVCTDQPCDPPFNLLLCQIAYDPAEGNAVQAVWQNGEVPYPAGINVLRDGTQLNEEPLAGDTTGVFFGLLAPGEHSFGIQGDCGPPSGASTITEGTFTTLAATPHANPVSGEISCSFNAELGETTATWTHADPSAFIDVYVFADPDLIFVTTIAGESTGVTIQGTTTPDQVLVLQFFAGIDGACYGSELLGCVFPGPPGNQLIRGVCNGVGGTPQITSAIFGLGFLFLGTEAPPCREACDVDGNGSVDITDMIFILSFLFSGGPAPPTWDGLTPTCERAPAEQCAVANEVCS